MEAFGVFSKGAINQAVIPFTQYTAFSPDIDTNLTRTSRATTPLTPVQESFLSIFLFRGRATIDWFDAIPAKTDTENVKFKYDRVISLNPGSAAGKVREVTHTHFMNHNIKYLDFEIGSNEVSANFSTTSRQGMGDMYVVDIFKGANLGSSAGSFSNLLWSPETTLYWHEK